MIAMKLVTALFVFFVSSSNAVADVAKAQQQEVQHLLSFIRHSICTIDRNGSLHDGEEAYRHVRKKYDYYRDEIDSSENFIAYAATKSMLSGRHYLVKCGNNPPITTEKWLLKELSHYRNR
jgi:malic enzyme